MRSVLEDFGVSMIALNTPSVDRKADNGVTSNHKIVFKDSKNLIVELGNFAALSQGPYRVWLNPQSSTFPDCAPCPLTAAPVNQRRS